jgi:DNA-binding transcriptional ArsR family regulator
MAIICRDKSFDQERVALADIFKAIGDVSRLKIVHALLAEELCVCELSAAVDMTPSAVSHQLRLLRTLKLVKRRREGQKIYYSLDDRHIEHILSEGLAHVREV